MELGKPERRLTERYTDEYYMSRSGQAIPYLVHVLLKLLRKSSSASVLDVGCGVGWITNLLGRLNYKAHGVDVSKYAAKRARQICASATDLPFASETFDAVISLSMIEHLYDFDVEKAMNEAYRILKCSGIIFLVTPNLFCPSRIILGDKWLEDSTHVNLMTPLKLRTLLMKHGFRRCALIHKSFPLLIYRKPSGSKWTLPYYGFNHFFKDKYFFQDILLFLLISTPIAYLRDTIWMVAYKPRGTGSSRIR